jgi:uncharacterized damage-inducible protein DinB
MLSRELIRDLLGHMEWADASVWRSVPQDVPVGDRLKVLLTHIHTVQYAFLTIWRSGDLDDLFKAVNELTEWPQLMVWGRAYYPQAMAFLDEASDAQLVEPVEMPWAAQVADFLGRSPGKTTLAETMLQVTSHSTYHRGQANTRLRELQVSPPSVDYIAWLWAGRPQAEWPV